jgi:hypothetical protein
MNTLFDRWGQLPLSARSWFPPPQLDWRNLSDGLFLLDPPSCLKNQELRTIVSEQPDQAISWCKRQGHMFEGCLIGFRQASRASAPDLKFKPTAASLDGRCLLSWDAGPPFTVPEQAQKLVQHLVFLEPGLHRHPGVLRCVRAKTLPVIGEETMARAGIDLELRGFSRCFQPFLHRLDLIWHNARVLGAVEAEHRRLDSVARLRGTRNEPSASGV